MFGSIFIGVMGVYLENMGLIGAGAVHAISILGIWLLVLYLSKIRPFRGLEEIDMLGLMYPTFLSKLAFRAKKIAVIILFSCVGTLVIGYVMLLINVAGSAQNFSVINPIGVLIPQSSFAVVEEQYGTIGVIVLQWITAISENMFIYGVAVFIQQLLYRFVIQEKTVTLLIGWVVAISIWASLHVFSWGVASGQNPVFILLIILSAGYWMVGASLPFGYAAGIGGHLLHNLLASKNMFAGQEFIQNYILFFQVSLIVGAMAMLTWIIASRFDRRIPLY